MEAGYGARQPHLVGVQEAMSAGIKLRQVLLEDAPCLHLWQGHPATRRYARDPYVPVFKRHYQWLSEKLDDPSCIFRMIQSNGCPVGTVRLDRGGEIYEVSINVDPGRHRQGIGGVALDLIAREVDSTIIAEVHPKNAASHALFRKAGWTATDDTHYRLTPVRTCGKKTSLDALEEAFVRHLEPPNQEWR
jgi:RimJ/RimL family protein N-acetyltransferase